jgi:hypothetical protein
MEPRVDIFVNKDDACVAADLSELFARIHKTSQVRIGHDFSYDDLRHSPTVLVGAFGNAWTVRMASELPFFLQERDSTIQERGGKEEFGVPEMAPGKLRTFILLRDC